MEKYRSPSRSKGTSTFRFSKDWAPCPVDFSFRSPLDSEVELLNLMTAVTVADASRGGEGQQGIFRVYLRINVWVSLLCDWLASIPTFLSA